MNEFTFTTEEKIRELRRELAMRKNLYSKWVGIGKMKADDADRLIAIMQAIYDDYTTEAALEAKP